MKIEEIIIEAPVNLSQRITNKFLSMLPGEEGRKAGGRRQASRVANDLKKSLQVWMGNTGQDKLTFKNFTIFMNSVGHQISSDSGYQNNDYLGRQAVDRLILQAVQQAFVKGAQSDTKTYPSYTGAKKSKPKQPQQKIDLSQVELSDLIDELTSRGQISTPDF